MEDYTPYPEGPSYDGKGAVKLIECPRDAMQGWKHLIPVEKKILYLNALLKVGFDTLDFGSFVSPRTIPQMADTKEVIPHLELRGGRSKLLAIVANVRGAEEAIAYEVIDYLGYPFSISETFQLRNTNKTIADSLEVVRQIQQLCTSESKELVVYISMGFGNPYGDPYDHQVVLHWVRQLTDMGIRIISLADTVGLAEPESIAYLYAHLIPAFSEISFGAHFHSTPQNWEAKIAAAYDHGCRRFDAAIHGIGGCPMASDELVGNMATENLLYFLNKKKTPLFINPDAFREAQRIATEIFL